MSQSLTDPTALTETFEHNGYLLKWTSFGSPSGQPLVFLHGTPWSSRLWAPIAKAVAKTGNYHIYLSDNPGYGQSHQRTAECQNATPAVSLADQASAFAAIAKDCWNLGTKERKPIIIAHDFGGIIALRANLLHGINYKALFLMDVVAIRPTGSPLFKLISQNASVFTQLPPDIFAAMLGAYISQASSKSLSPPYLAELCAPWVISQGTRTNFIQQVAQMTDDHLADVDGRYGEISAEMPVKIMWAKDDKWIHVDAAGKLAELMGLGDEDVVIVEEAGHLIMVDQPERVTAEICRFLDGLQT
ncbi:alpha/beta hydrolase fold protein [Tothia fuscella]|uniref:Alpha/beta hydrolase fold protein n=1 Tax=Tothia fuscella TaxID=1048955 RepID=A0A9P4NGC0_9PEZI|nr:alpha/beta hydrolase fold protein [Tothia fuscella]